jgi:general secretion pathway protein B
MSYILEALKKAQAERQLGDVPGLHAPTLQAAPAAGAGERWRKPLWLALAGLSLAVVALSAIVLRQAPVPATGAPVPGSGAPAAPPVPPAPANRPAPALSPSPVAPVPHQASALPAMAPDTVPAALEEPLPPPKPRKAKPVPAEAAAVKPRLAREPESAAKAASVAGKPASAATAPAGTMAASMPPPEENLPGVQELPEPIQRQLPPIAIGGYIYSKKAEDRLLLIDKVLRHEGEQVAPGLTLEKLQPKSAVFSFNGYRYRVPY